jgi:LacI family repressor for deo operon, udp, cdd, tsx, nupC, and nupG
VATVSRVVNGKPGVSEETRHTVGEALEFLGYDRPAAAIRRRTPTIGLIVPELENPIFPLFVREIENALAAEGYTPMLCTASPVINEDEYLDVLLDRGVRGVVLVSGRHANTEVDHARYAEVLASGTPLVFINGYLQGLPAPFVSSDDTQAAQAAIDHLISLGHRRIGMALGPARYLTTQRRIDGYRRAMLHASQELATRDGHSRSDDDLIVTSVDSVEGGQSAAEELLERGVTAIVCASDLMALGVIRTAHARGLQVPRDLSVVGYDDTPLVSFTNPPLTTVRQNVSGISRHAVQALLSEIHDEPTPRRELLVTTELVVRQSTGPLRGR